MLSRTSLAARALPSPLALLFLTLLLAVLALAGCNTMSGVGEDVSAAGRGIDQTSEATQEKLTGKEHTQPPRTTTNPSGGY